MEHRKKSSHNDHKEMVMTQTFHLTSSAQLYENVDGGLAIRFENNVVFEGVGMNSEQNFVVEALEYLASGKHPRQWQEMPFRRLQHDGQGWHLVSSVGFLDGDETRPTVGLDVKPENLGEQARRYLKPAMPQVLS
jgi:hypothetical protein